MTQEAVSFALAGDELTVRDEAGGGDLVIEVDDGTSLTPATDAWFDVPVDAAVSVETASIELRKVTSAQLRSDDGKHYGTITDEEFTVGGGTYLDISALLKLLVFIDDATIRGRLVGDGENPESLRIEFDEPTAVVIGARSFHKAPLVTMSVPENDPDALMTAASFLGTSIKEWSAERSWSTLRGHPPAISAGEQLQIPDSLSTPGTEITVAVPSDIASVLRVTPLAYYFGADIVPGSEAELRLGSQYVEPLGTGTELEQSVDELLAQSLVLDSLVRIGGYYSMPRYEYEELAPELPFYPPELYDEPIHRQLLEYLEVPFDTVEPYVPDWTTVGTLRPITEDATAVPYLLSTLSRVHVTENGVPRGPSTLGKPVDLSTSRSVPRGAAALPPAARERAADHEHQSPDSASVLFVGWEHPDPNQFTSADWERFDLGENDPVATYRPSVTCDELRTLLAGPYVHVHYGNRVSETGFVCSDGVLAFDDLPDGTVGSLSFRWCRPSIAPATGALDVASVITLVDEPISLATAHQLSVYLVIGRSVVTSVRLADIDGVRFLGDSTLAPIRRPTGHPPIVYRFERDGTDAYRVSVQFDTDESDTLGKVAQSRFDAAPDSYQLVGTRTVIPETFSRAELPDMVNKDIIPRFEWSSGSEAAPTSQLIADIPPE